MTPLSQDKLRSINAYWGTTPGLNFIYVHLNRIIRQRNLDDAIFTTYKPIIFTYHGYPWLRQHAVYVKKYVQERLIAHKEYIRAYGEDMPEIRNWKW